MAMVGFGEGFEPNWFLDGRGRKPAEKVEEGA